MNQTFIRDVMILSMDEQVGTISRGGILIEDDQIAAIGPSLDIPEGAKVINAEGMIAMPGFVNAHIHSWQTPLRGLAADWTLSEYLRAIHAGLAGYFTPNDIRVANRFGAQNQIASGTTTIADWCHNNPTPDHSDAAIDGLIEAGIRAVFLHGSPKPDAKPGQKHFSEIPMPEDEVRRLREGRLSADDALVTMGLAILGPQLSVWEVCEADFKLARDMALIASMHVSGPLLAEDGFERLAAAGLLGPHINVVHGNALSDARLALLVEAGVQFTLTPEIEMQMGFGEPLTSRLCKLGGNISLGSDIESATAGDMFGVTRMTLQAARHADNLAAIAQNGASPQTISIPVREALYWATMGGAKMLGLDDRIGSLSPGKQADIVLLDTRTPNMSPVIDVPSSILFHAGVGNVDTVMVAGKLRKAGGVLVGQPANGAFEELAVVSNRLIAAFNAGNAEQGS